MNIFDGILQLESQKKVARDTLQYFFRVIEGRHLINKEVVKNTIPYQAGQFINLLFGTKDWRSYSIASTPDQDLIELVVRLIPGGIGSEHLRTMKDGDFITFKGAFGHFVLSETPTAHLVFCGTGTGIAPLKAMICQENQAPNPRPMTLLYGGRDAEDIAYLEELQPWAPQLQIKLGFSQDPDAHTKNPLAENCRITQFIENETWADQHEFHICGNGAMVKSVEALLTKKGLNKKQIFMERFN